MSTLFDYHIRVAVAAEERRTFLARSQAGLERALKEGRYSGGPIPLGYTTEGKKGTARLVISDIPIWGDWTEAGLMRQIFEWLVDGWTCPKMSDHLNRLGVPTAYEKDGRLMKERGGVRRRKTQNKWRPGRIRNMVTNPVYKGEFHFGRRSKRNREIVVVPVPALVSEELWVAAQRALENNRIHPKGGAKRVYELRSVVRCAICGLNYSGATHRGATWYRCNGQITWKGKIDGRCPSKSFRGDALERIVLGDIDGFLRNPGDLIDELVAEQQTAGDASNEAELVVVEQALASIPTQRDRIIDAYRRDRINQTEFDAQMESIAQEENALRRRVAELSIDCEPPAPGLTSEALLAELRARLDAGLDERQRQELVFLLVKQITMHTETDANGKKRLRAVVEYRFPDVVVDDRTGRGSSS